LITCFLYVQEVNAKETVPVPQNKASLEQLQNELELQKEQEAELKQRLDSINRELKETKSDLVSLASTIKDSENKLNSLEESILKLETERNGIKTRLENDYGSISDLILALERIRRVPPEAIIAKPGKPIETARSAMLLQSILPDLYNNASELYKDLERLDTIGKTLQEDKKEQEKIVNSLQDKQISLNKLLKKRTALYNSTRVDHDNAVEKSNLIAKEAKSLKDLLYRLENERIERERTSSLRKRHIKKKRYAKKAKLPSVGKIQLPVSGLIKVSYGQKDKLGVVSRGISIESRNGASVVAPMGGIVRFAGDFKNHDKVVIVEHADGYHSLVTGLSSVNVSPDQPVVSGEPLGSLSSEVVSRPVLYYELRHKGETIDPAIKFDELRVIN
jgi:septal ring factor EnvC (AmiA/AmiB activator)